MQQAWNEVCILSLLAAPQIRGYPEGKQMQNVISFLESPLSFSLLHQLSNTFKYLGFALYWLRSCLLLSCLLHSTPFVLWRQKSLSEPFCFKSCFTLNVFSYITSLSILLFILVVSSEWFLILLAFLTPYILFVYNSESIL